MGPSGVSKDGVSVVLLGGDLEVVTKSVKLLSESRLEVVPVAETLVPLADEAARRGLHEFACIIFAPGVGVGGDGDLLLAAVRKGVGQRARLAGAMTGDQVAFDRGQVFTGRDVSTHHAVLTGVFSSAPIGIAARHGWKPTGRVRRVTRSDGPWLVTLDGKPAFDVWVADARAAGLEAPADRTQKATIFLAGHCVLSVRDGDREEPVVRIPLAVRPDGAVRLSGAVGETARTRLMRGSRGALLEAARQAARAARSEVEGRVAGGVILTCASRVAVLGADFGQEAKAVALELDAPVGGASVFGEIARGPREIEAFHNATLLVLAVPEG